ncbi:MAG: hypothetical protein J6F30_06835 [Cellulosilyticum sp.]|nr:hypothetical protein [Cellulosilyticum sp.]
MNIRWSSNEMPWKQGQNIKGAIKGKINVNGKSIKLQDTRKEEQAQSTEKENTVNLDTPKSREDTRKQMLEEAVKRMQEELWGEDSEERYSEILRKADAGEDLSEKDMAYLRSKNPKLYYEIKSEQMVEKTFEERLKHCKTKEEAEDAYIMTLDSVGHMSGMKGEGKIKQDKQKYKRLVKRINKVWQKYKSKKLGKKDEKPKDVQVVQEDTITRQAVKVFEQFQDVSYGESIYDEQG